MQSKVTADLKRNRLILTYKGIVSKKDAGEMYTDARFAAADLRPGFDIISDFTGCRMAYVSAIATLRRMIHFLVEKGAGEAVRIQGKTSIINKQIINLATRVPGLRPIQAATMEEAEKKLESVVRREGMRIHFQDLPVEYVSDGRIRNGNVDNISISGCAVSSAAEIPSLDTEVSLIFVCQRADSAPIELKVSGKVVRSDAKDFAVHFEESDQSVKYELFAYILYLSQNAEDKIKS